jgi:hypothetical protein
VIADSVENSRGFSDASIEVGINITSLGLDTDDDTGGAGVTGGALEQLTSWQPHGGKCGN